MQGLESALGHRFGDPRLLRQALTHRSYSAQHNERLEFLGDSVLGLAVAELLFQRLAGQDEGFLTRLRARLVREETLFQVALELGLDQHILLSEGELKGGGKKRPSILADAFEAVLGAVFLDKGYEAARQVVHRCLAPKIDSLNTGPDSNKDAKTALQERLQAKRLPVPVYSVAATRGQAHDQIFEVWCEVASHGLRTTGEGKSRRSAEQAAAAAMMNRLEASDERKE